MPEVLAEETFWEVYTETGGHWEICDTQEDAQNRANVLAQKHRRAFSYRRQYIKIVGPWVVEPQKGLFDD